MALRWFLGVATTQIVGQPDDERSEKTEKKQVKMASRESEATGVKSSSHGYGGGFQLPLHYPRYKKEEYEKMEEWKVDVLLMQYGLACEGSLEEKRAFAMGTFLW